MEDWRQESKGSNSSYKSEKVLLSIARQKIWIHWLLWCIPFPYLNVPGSILSGVLLREWRPVAAVISFAILLSMGGGSLEAAGTLLYFSHFGAAAWCHYIIQKSRDEIDEIRSK